MQKIFKGHNTLTSLSFRSDITPTAAKMPSFAQSKPASTLNPYAMEFYPAMYYEDEVTEVRSHSMRATSACFPRAPGTRARPPMRGPIRTPRRFLRVAAIDA